MRLSGLAAVLLWSCGAAPAEEARVAADLVLVARSVVTFGDPSADSSGARVARVGEAVAVRGGTIVWVGDAAGAEAHIGPSTRVLRRPDAVVVPGLVDAHAHLTGLGKAASQLDLRGTVSAAAVAQAVRAVPAGDGWIEGRGWDHNDWKVAEFPTHALLTEASPERPVALRRVDGHVLWANAAAMKAAGVTRDTEAPAGGRIERDATGEPTGVFVDAAMALVQDKMPPPTDGQLRGWIQKAVGICHEVGLTGVHDAGASARIVAIYEALDAAGALPLRVHVLLDGADPDIEPLVARGPKPGAYASVRGVKLFADGALGSRGAWLKAPYSDAPTSTGIPVVHGDALKTSVRRYADAGFQIGVHAIGDAAAADAIDAFEAAGVTPARRFRLEHAQVVHPTEQKRMATLGILAMVQPTHATSDMPWAEQRLGPDRIRTAYAWRSLLNAGVRLGLGSDFPVERPDPLEGLYAAVNRTDKAGAPNGGWYPEEALTAAEALRGFTVDAAFAGFVEAHRGRIAPGFDADLTLLDDDPTGVDPQRLDDLKVLGVVVGGQVFEAAR